jgi:hypothetical protein
VTTLGLAAYTRVDTPSANRRDFFVYIDEFQSFTTLALANMLSELRKYRVGFTIAHQYLHQLTPEIRHAVLGNVGTFVSFRIGPEDAPYVVREFQSNFAQEDLIQLANYRIYLKLMIDGIPSWPFSARTFAELGARPARGSDIAGFPSSANRSPDGFQHLLRCKRNGLDPEMQEVVTSRRPLPTKIRSITGAYRVGHRCAPGSYRLRGANCTIFRRLVFNLGIELSAE